MAINPETQYPGKITPSTPDYPYGAARNITVPGDGTGTPWEAALVNDLFGFQQALLLEASMTPSGTPDHANDSQYLSALKNLFRSGVAFSFPTVDNMKSQPDGIVTQSMIDAVDLPALTMGYFDGWGASKEPSGGAMYALTTVQRVRDGLGDPAWTPDGLGDHYLFGGNDYVAKLLTDPSHTILQYGAVQDGVNDDWLSANAMYLNNGGVVRLPAGDVYFGSTIIVANDDSNPIILTGEGRQKTILKPLNGGNLEAVYIDKKLPADSAVRYCEFRDFTIDGSEFPKTCRLVRGLKVSFAIFENINSFSCYSTIQVLEDFFLIKMKKVFMSLQTYGLKQTGFGTSLHVDNCNIDFSDHGWELEQIRYSCFTSTAADSIGRGQYAYSFDRCNVVLNGCGAESVWNGVGGSIGGGLFKASGQDCTVTVNNCTFWGGNNGAENKDITIADLGLSDQIIQIDNDATVLWNNSSIRSFVNRGNSLDHLPARVTTGHAMVKGNGIQDDGTGTNWATIDVWEATSTGNLTVETDMLMKLWRDGNLLYNVGNEKIVPNHWQTLGLVDIDSVSLCDGDYRVNVGGGSAGTLPTGNSGVGLYSLRKSPDSTTAYATYQDNNGLFAVRNYAASVWSVWSVK